MSLPRQNAKLVDDAGRPTREFYDWMRRLETAIPPETPESALNDIANVSTSGLTDGDVLTYDNTFGRWVNAQPAALEAVEDELGGSVALATTATWYDGPSVSLSAGTWVVNAHATFSRTTATATTWEARVGDGTTTYASSGITTPATTNQETSLAMTTVITLGATTTIKIQATTNAGAAACLMRETTFLNAETGATKITAIRIS